MQNNCLTSLNSIEQYLDIIDKELSIRKLQLNNLLDILNVLKEQDNNSLQFTFVRETIPTLYSHFEGFFKFCFINLIEYIKELDLDNSTINPQYIFFCLLTNLDDEHVNFKKKSKALSPLCSSIYADNSSYFNHINIRKYPLNQESFEYTLKMLNIDTQEIKFSYLKSFYKRRCAISHGQLDTSNAFSLLNSRSLTSNQTSKALDIWQADFNVTLSSLDIIKKLFIEYIINEQFKI